MTDKQDRFCEEYMIDLNATKRPSAPDTAPKPQENRHPGC